MLIAKMNPFPIQSHQVQDLLTQVYITWCMKQAHCTDYDAAYQCLLIHVQVFSHGSCIQPGKLPGPWYWLPKSLSVHEVVNFLAKTMCVGCALCSYMALILDYIL